MGRQAVVRAATGKGDERRVEVVSTAAKHLRKPKGAAPGLVNVSKSDTLTVEL